MVTRQEGDERRIEDSQVYVLRLSAAENELTGHSARIASDQMGRVLFREPIDQGRIERGLEKCLRVASTVLTKASMFAERFEVEKLKLKLGLDSEIGCGFIADASIAASLEIEITRSPSCAGTGGLGIASDSPL